jgi:hypothetical protein
VIEQRGNDARPLGVEIVGGDRLPGAVIPVGGVAEVAFPAMQIRVDPRAGLVFEVLRDLVGTLPLARPSCHSARRGSLKVAGGSGF